MRSTSYPLQIDDCSAFACLVSRNSEAKLHKVEEEMDKIQQRGSEYFIVGTKRRKGRHEGQKRPTARAN
ncbi:uncharacterized protein TrAFT101_000551 [Trichoderma asperellum]|uniref:uncharacterized protein n=1 Tax=Trichoderma asperellum TaxID=101201 RepID=UPI003334524C|nr:hypothetical protein TrAFT101_000551 [Trichoderma asperellum]